MTHVLHYGQENTLQLDVPPEAMLADISCRGEPLDDPVAAVAAALCDPLDFPPLAEAIIPGDRVAIALEPGLPQVAAVTAGLVHALLEGNTRPEEIVIVQTAEDASQRQEDPRALLADDLAQAIEIVQHDPQDRESLAYLAASKENKPIYINRTLHDADVVLPVGLLRLDGSLGYMGVYGGLFPAFSDPETQQRFAAVGSSDQAVQQKRRRDEAEEAAWQLGVLLTVQIVPAAGEGILHVLAGSGKAIAQQGQAICRDAWQSPVPRRADLVVATIEGGPRQQTWENVGRALFAASQIASNHGAIVLCTELSCRPGPALQKLAGLDNGDAVLREILRDRTADALPAAQLIDARQRGAHVYLLSELDDEVVEDLGLGHVAQGEEVQRLSRQHESCILLSNAQYALPQAEDE